MEVVLDRDAFLKGLQMVHNIVEPRQTLPILANVLLRTDGMFKMNEPLSQLVDIVGNLPILIT